MTAVLYGQNAVPSVISGLYALLSKMAHVPGTRPKNEERKEIGKQHSNFAQN